MKTLLIGLAIVVGTFAMAMAETPRVVGRMGAVNGILVKVDGRDLIVRVKQRTGEPKEITLPTDDYTEVRVDGDAGTLDDLRPEMAVSITPMGRGVPGAAKLLVRATSKSLSGVVLKVDGRNLLIRAQQEGAKKEVTVETNASTKIMFANGGELGSAREGNFEDIKPEMKVKVLPDTGVARKIVVSGVVKTKNK